MRIGRQGIKFDKNMPNDLEGIFNPTLRERLDKSIVEKIIGMKERFGMGSLKRMPEGMKIRSDPLADELHKPVTRKYERRKVRVNSIDEIWTADLIDMQVFSKFNRGVKYVLAVIDVFSEYGWVFPLRDRTGKSVADVLKTIFKTGRKPTKMQVDKGKEVSR